jgi:hypothetical protein
MKPMSLLALSILLVTGGCPFGPVDPPPPPDDCGSPGALDGVESIEVGTLEPGTGAFVAWQDGANVELTHGSQGGAMLGVVLALRGSGLPACVRHTMELRGRFGGETMARTDYPVRTYLARGGIRITNPVWLIFSGQEPGQNDQLALTLQVDDFEVSRSLVIDAPLPEYLNIPADPLSAGSRYTMEIGFDRAISSNMAVTVASSDPAVVRPLEPTVRTNPDYYWSTMTELEAVAPGGPVTISVTASGQTITTEVTVE